MVSSGRIEVGAAQKARRPTPEEEEAEGTFQDGDGGIWRREGQLGLPVSHSVAVQPQELLPRHVVIFSEAWATS